jgi:hypothetical protein
MRADACRGRSPPIIDGVSATAVMTIRMLRDISDTS